MRAACRVVADIIAAGVIPAALEILDQATIRAVESSVYRAGYPTEAAAVLLAEFDGARAQVDADAEVVREIAGRHGALRLEEATTPAERKRLWQGRKGAFGAMGRLRPDLYVLDGVVPRPRLEETLAAIAAIGSRHRVHVSNVFHAGDGNLHPNISYDGRVPEETARVLAAGHEILALCMAMGGSITGEHGIGSEKLAHVPLMFAPADLEVMARVRRAFDPSGRCNPGKVLPERSACAEPAKWPQLVARVLQAAEPETA
jgi:FAD/FMN-containing dehydrogenase